MFTTSYISCFQTTEQQASLTLEMSDEEEKEQQAETEIFQGNPPSKTLKGMDHNAHVSKPSAT